MNKNYSIVKLANGDNIICNVIDNSENVIEVESPLKMEIVSRNAKGGIAESLTLSRWLQPFSDESKFSLNKSTVILNAPVTIGLGKYYEFILKKMDKLDIEGPSEKELKSIEEEEKRNLKKQMLEYIKDDVTIH